jgi:hypothetical protein
VASIEADTHPGFILDAVNDRSEVFEAVAKGGALTCSIFDHCRDARGSLQCPVERVGNALEARSLFDAIEVGAGVEVEQHQTQLFAALHLIEKRLTRFRQSFLIGVAEIDQVTVVGKDLIRRDAGRFQVGAKSVNALGCERLGMPLTLILGE